MSAEVTIDRLTPDQSWVVVREGGGGVVAFVLFVAGVAAAIYLLMPAARATPGPLVGVLTLAIGWAGVALTAREKYVADRSAQTVTAKYTSLLGRREIIVSAQEIAAVRLGVGGPDDNRRLVELVGANGRVRLRLPRRVNTFTASDQTTVGELLAECLSLPLQSQ